MILKQWYQCLNTNMSGRVGNFKDVKGVTKSMFSTNKISIFDSSFDAYMGKVPPSMPYQGGAVFGTGNTPPTVNDYCLSGSVIDPSTGVKFVVNTNIEKSDNACTGTCEYTITNNSGASIIIGEVGIAYPMANGASSVSGEGVGLLERTALDTPITIEAGGVGKVTYTIEFALPTA